MVDRCDWAKSDIMIDYHDNEWGVPMHDDNKLFELLMLECNQAGLTWETILKRRENYRKAFDKFDPVKVSKYGEDKIQELLLDAGIIRNKLKVRAMVSNAISFLEIQKEFDSFDKYIWSFVDSKTIVNKFDTMSEVPGFDSVAETMSKDLKKRGFKFVGPTICYAFMQSAGLVNDHLVGCHCYNKCK